MSERPPHFVNFARWLSEIGCRECFWAGAITRAHSCQWGSVGVGPLAANDDSFDPTPPKAA